MIHDILAGVIPIPEQAFPEHALALLAGLLEGCGALWVVGGSTGLAMRGADIGRPPRDLDVYADEADAKRLHELLKRYATDEPQTSVTGMYRSILSHYRIGETAVELVGAFRVTTERSDYRTEVRSALHPLGDALSAGGRPVRLAPVGHELIFNVLRGRPDRCSMAGALIGREPERHMPPLKTLLDRNRLSDADVRSILRYASGNAPG